MTQKKINSKDLDDAMGKYIKDCFGEEVLEFVTKEKTYNTAVGKQKKRRPGKMVDIHTKIEVSNNDRYKNAIDNDLVKEYVLQNIDFPLTDEFWIAIDNAFADIWNNKLGIGGYFYWDEITNQIFSELQKKKMLIEFERIDKITNLILTYIENNGGFLE